MMYGFSTKTNVGFEESIERTKAALAEEGFGVLTTIDVQATMKVKLDIDGKPYTILGACNPKLAHQAISAEPDIGLLLPCNVLVREEEDGSVTVAFMDPVAVLGMVDKPGIEELAGQVRAKLMNVRDSL